LSISFDGIAGGLRPGGEPSVPENCSARGQAIGNDLGKCAKAPLNAKA
jgi:hypothetical protein